MSNLSRGVERRVAALEAKRPTEPDWNLDCLADDELDRLIELLGRRDAGQDGHDEDELQFLASVSERCLRAPV